VQYLSFGALGKSFKNAYAPSPAARNAFLLKDGQKKKTRICSSMAPK
jgi:hypothetical protein